MILYGTSDAPPCRRGTGPSEGACPESYEGKEKTIIYIYISLGNIIYIYIKLKPNLCWAFGERREWRSLWARCLFFFTRLWKHTSDYKKETNNKKRRKNNRKETRSLVLSFTYTDTRSRIYYGIRRELDILEFVHAFYIYLAATRMHKEDWPSPFFWWLTRSDKLPRRYPLADYSWTCVNTFSNPRKLVVKPDVE